MLSMLAVLTHLLLVSAALADRSSHRHARLARRREDRRSQSSNRVEPRNSGPTPIYNKNWAGAIWSAMPNTFTTVTALITVPIPSGNAGSAASAWVGIDGYTCQGVALQTGVDLIISNDGEPAYIAWYEWLPADAIDFLGFDVSAGDNLNLTVTALSATSGVATIQNLSTRETISESLTSTQALCRQDAEWIVGDYYDNNTLVPFTNFHSVTFSHAYGSDSYGVLYEPADATLHDIEQNNQVLTSSSANGSSLIVEYTG